MKKVIFFSLLAVVLVFRGISFFSNKNNDDEDFDNQKIESKKTPIAVIENRPPFVTPTPTPPPPLTANPAPKKNKSKKSPYLELCQKGDMQQCFNQAVFLAQEGVEKDAIRFYREACEAGVAQACVNLGLIEQNKGNATDAKNLYAKACDEGRMLGCYNLGFLEMREGNSDEAKALFRRSCFGNEMRGCVALGIYYVRKNNNKKAQKFFDKACKGKWIEGCTYQAISNYMKASKTDPSINNQLTESCQLNEAMACRLRAYIKEEGNPRETWNKYKIDCQKAHRGEACWGPAASTFFRHRYPATKKMLTVACDIGDKLACSKIIEWNL